MSTYADPNKAYVWLDGDGFRGAPGMTMPTDPFAAEIPDMKPYGGIETGFEVTAEQSVNKKKVWNYRKAAYKITRDPLEEGIKFRAVDNTEATALTRAQGGKVTKTASGLYLLEKGIGEEFSFLARFEDEDEKSAIWCPRATLSGPATRAAIDGQNIDGWEFPLTFLEPAVEVLPALPSGMTEPTAPGA
ncbi:hypothetical protein QVA66_03950 [Staphylococcus chromogenes]|nr:hypothetical protein [Staphylococcus chromogenes]